MGRAAQVGDRHQLNYRAGAKWLSFHHAGGGPPIKSKRLLCPSVGGSRRQTPLTEGAFPQAKMRSINCACCCAIDKSVGSLGVATAHDLIETRRESLFVTCFRHFPAKKGAWS